MKKITMLLAAATLAMSSTAFAASKADAEKAIADAKAATSAAKKVGFEWRDTDKKLIKKAEAAMKKGDYNTALKLAKEAKAQSELAQQQAKDQANAGPLH